MKMSQQDFDSLKPALLTAKRQLGILPGNIPSIRQQWDIFHRAWSQGAIDGGDLYKRYNDTHIETAMKAIFR